MTMPKGFREEIVAGKARYVGADGSGVAVVGPVRHKFSRKRRGEQTGQVARTQKKLVEMTGVERSLAIEPGIPTPTRRQRIRWALGDLAWHEQAQANAKTCLMWSFTIAASIVFGKGMWWVLCL